MQRPQNTIYVFHTHPDNTALDLTTIKTHVGSMALRCFIEAQQPFLTLHGHIHETVSVSGHFMHRIGKTFCMAPGNDPYKEKPAVIVFNLNNPKKAKRLFL